AALGKGSGEDGTAKDNVIELINAAAVYDSQTQEPSLIDYLQQIALFSDTDVYDAASRKTAMMTLHAAKGLEFDSVFIIGAEEGLLPHERSAGSPDELEEERRLMFVGMTRARKTLDISFAKHRIIRGMYERTVPSQFLYEMGADINEPLDDHAMAGGSGGRTDGAAGELRYEALDENVGLGFQKGQLVRHPKFGLGRVTGFVPMGEASTVSVSFNAAGTKTLMLKYAHLTREID
ncbi:MAG TPA: 3'-5' exonuclease, partial [Sedimentisphaerales bacterium]|nr:3'-5' exonuclease [Sedimentisphaerales bacterium]